MTNIGAINLGETQSEARAITKANEMAVLRRRTALKHSKSGKNRVLVCVAGQIKLSLVCLFT